MNVVEKRITTFSIYNCLGDELLSIVTAKTMIAQPIRTVFKTFHISLKGERSYQFLYIPEKKKSVIQNIINIIEPKTISNKPGLMLLEYKHDSNLM
jgi:hypothetical protein